MPAGDEHLDQLRADKSGGPRHEGRRSCIACHVGSVAVERANDHRQRPHDTRTPPVRGGKMSSNDGRGFRTIRSATQSAPRSCGLHARGTGNDRRPVGPRGERARTWRTAAAACGDRALAVGGSRPDRRDAERVSEKCTSARSRCGSGRSGRGFAASPSDGPSRPRCRDG